MDFVVGHPRSGTQLVARLLNAGGATVSEHELLARLSPRSVALTSEFHAGRTGADAIANVLDAYARRAATLRIDCNWKLTWILPVLVEKFPGARIVHLTRHPLANVQSCVDLDYYGGLVARRDYQTDPQRNRWLRWLPRLRRPDWERLSPVERNCAFWRETHQLLLGLATRPGYLRVRLEDLGDPEVLGGLFDHLAVARPSRGAIDRVLVERVNAKIEEKAEVRSLRGSTTVGVGVVTRFCADVAARLGYSIDSA